MSVACRIERRESRVSRGELAGTSLFSAEVFFEVRELTDPLAHFEEYFRTKERSYRVR